MLYWLPFFFSPGHFKVSNDHLDRFLFLSQTNHIEGRIHVKLSFNSSSFLGRTSIIYREKNSTIPGPSVGGKDHWWVDIFSSDHPDLSIHFFPRSFNHLLSLFFSLSLELSSCTTTRFNNHCCSFKQSCFVNSFQYKSTIDKYHDRKQTYEHSIVLIRNLELTNHHRSYYLPFLVGLFLLDDLQRAPFCFLSCVSFSVLFRLIFSY